jgi:hypothetical protein
MSRAKAQRLATFHERKLAALEALKKWHPGRSFGLLRPSVPCGS